MRRMEIAKWPLSESVPLLPIFPQHCSVTIAIAILHSFVPATIFNKDLFDTFIAYRPIDGSISILSRNHFIVKIYLNKDEVLAKMFLISLIDLNIREIIKNQDTSTS